MPTSATDGHFESVDQVLSYALNELYLRYGKEAVDRGILGLSVVLALFALYVVYGIVRLFSSPPRPKRPSSHEPTSESNRGATTTKKGASASTAEAAAAATSVPAAAPVPTTTTAKAPKRAARTREPTSRECGPLKANPMLGVVACSPDGFISVVSSREKRVVKAYPQYAIPLAEVKNVRDAIVLEDVPNSAIITRVAFNSTGGSFLLIDDVDAKSYLYRYSFDTDAALASPPKVHVTFLRAGSLDSRVLGAKHEHCVLSDDASVLYLLLQKEGSLDAVDVKTGHHIGNTKVKAGNTAAWSFANHGRFCAAGSYMTDIRGYSVAIRNEHTSGAVTLTKLFSISDANNARVWRLAWSGDGSRLAVQYAGAEGRIHIYATDVDFARDEAPVLLDTFADPDFCECDTFTLSYFPANSTSLRRDLNCMLVKGSDVVVYRMDRAHERAAAAKPRSQRVLEVHEAHDGEAIRWAGIASRGSAVVTGSEEDSRNIVRLWTVENKQQQT